MVFSLWGKQAEQKPIRVLPLQQKRTGIRQCSMHYIRYDVLYAYVLARLQYWSMLAQKDEDKLLKRLLNASDRERNSAKKKQAAELKKAEKRKAEVFCLFLLDIFFSSCSRYPAIQMLSDYFFMYSSIIH